MATLRVILDTNVLVSGIAYPFSIPGKIITAWRNGSIEVLLSSYILDELRTVLPRLGHRHDLRPDEIEDLVEFLTIQADLIDPDTNTDAGLRDNDDQLILGTLRAGQEAYGVDYLITGDKDLLALADRYAIITPAGFWSTHGSL